MSNQRAKNKKRITTWMEKDLHDAVVEYAKEHKIDRSSAMKFICRSALGLPIPFEDRSSNAVCGATIQELRKKNGWPQHRLAKECQKAGWNMSREVIFRLEHGLRPITDSELKKLANILGVSTRKLLAKK